MSFPANINQHHATETTTSVRRLTNVIEIELRGTETLKEKFQQGESHVEILNDRWKLILRRERTDSGNHVAVFLGPIPSSSEINELSNLWARRAKWTVEFKKLDGRLTIWKRETLINCGTIEQDNNLCPGPLQCFGWKTFTTDAQFFDPQYEVYHNRNFTSGFLIINTIDELFDTAATALSFNSNQYRRSSAATLAQDLLNPDSGDVIFEMEGETRKLYAWSHILSAKCDYFAAMFGPNWSKKVKIKTVGEDSDSDIPGPSSRSSSLSSASTTHSSDTTNTFFPRKTITCTEDFTTMHNLLYFIYTGFINLHFGSRPSQGSKVEVDGYPEPADPFYVYQAADMYLLEPLAERCLRYLELTCTVENICDRLFGVREDVNSRLRGVYMDFLLGNYEKVKKTQGWLDRVRGIGNMEDRDERKNCLETILEIMDKLKFAK